MYGIQTYIVLYLSCTWFENDVKMYGIQTKNSDTTTQPTFENDVKMYGIQTDNDTEDVAMCLRMM